MLLWRYPTYSQENKSPIGQLLPSSPPLSLPLLLLSAMSSIAAIGWLLYVSATVAVAVVIVVDVTAVYFDAIVTVVSTAAAAIAIGNVAATIATLSLLAAEAAAVVVVVVADYVSSSLSTFVAEPTAISLSGRAVQRLCLKRMMPAPSSDPNSGRRCTTTPAICALLFSLSLVSYPLDRDCGCLPRRDS